MASFLISSMNISGRTFLPKLASNYCSMRNGSVSSHLRNVRTLMTSNNMNDDLLQPWMMLPPETSECKDDDGGSNRVVTDNSFKFYSLAEKRVVSVPIKSGLGSDTCSTLSSLKRIDERVIVGSSHGWLAIFNEFMYWDIFLFNPLSDGGRRIQLPPVHTLPWPESYGPCVSKIILSGSPEDPECRAMMSYSAWNRLAFCRPGNSTEWTPIGDFHHKDGVERNYEDFVYSNKLDAFFCAIQLTEHILTREVEFEVWDLRGEDQPTVTKLELEVDKGNYPFAYSSQKELDLKDRCEVLNFLVAVDSSGEFLLLRRYVYYHQMMQCDGEYLDCSEHFENAFTRPYQTAAFDVYRHDAEAKALRYVDHNNDNSLDGMALFVGMNHSFAVSAADHQQIKPNSIYFTDGGVWSPGYYNEQGDFGGHDIGIYNYQDRTFEPCYYPRDIPSIKRIVPKPIWFTPVGN